MPSKKRISSNRRSSSLQPHLDGAPLVEVRRGARVESRHHVAACAVDAAGGNVLEIGNVDVPVFLRSSAKPFIAAAIVLGGAVDAFGIDERELALISASHAGEPAHIETALAILGKAGIDPSALRCGGEPSPLHNNCSGKHAGILALAKHMGAPLESYLEPDHPAQRAILALCERAVGEPLGPGRLAVDGCGIPVFATSLRRAARAFARLADPATAGADGPPIARVRAAMLAHPWFLSGTGKFDTALIEAGAGAFACKGGAEGVHCTAMTQTGGGLAIKVIDGASRATSPAVVALLGRMGLLDEAMRHRLRSFAEPAVRNVAGRIVGSIVPSGAGEDPFA